MPFVAITPESLRLDDKRCTVCGKGGGEISYLRALLQTINDKDFLYNKSYFKNPGSARAHEFCTQRAIKLYKLRPSKCQQ